MILELLQRVCKSLEDHNIPYMVSGSVALNIYSIPRMTRDIDIVVERDENRIDPFISLFPDSYKREVFLTSLTIKPALTNIAAYGL